MIDNYGYDGERLQHSLEDLVRRCKVLPSEIQPVCERQGLRVPAQRRVAVATEAAVDYVSMLEEVHVWQKARKAARKSGRDRIARILKLD